MAGKHLHPVLAGICMSGILAAIMSTASAQLLVASSAFAEDFYKGMFRRDPGRAELLWVGRGTVLVIAVLAYLLALNPDNKVLDLVAWAWAGFGAAFGPAIVLSLYWDRMTRNGALAGMIVGGLTVILWKQGSGGIFELYEMVPGVRAQHDRHLGLQQEIGNRCQAPDFPQCENRSNVPYFYSFAITWRTTV